MLGEETKLSEVAHSRVNKGDYTTQYKLQRTLGQVGGCDARGLASARRRRRRPRPAPRRAECSHLPREIAEDGTRPPRPRATPGARAQTRRSIARERSARASVVGREALGEATGSPPPRPSSTSPNSPRRASAWRSSGAGSVRRWRRVPGARFDRAAARHITARPRSLARSLNRSDAAPRSPRAPRCRDCSPGLVREGQDRRVPQLGREVGDQDHPALGALARGRGRARDRGARRTPTLERLVEGRSTHIPSHPTPPPRPRCCRAPLERAPALDPATTTATMRRRTRFSFARPSVGSRRREPPFVRSFVRSFAEE